MSRPALKIYDPEISEKKILSEERIFPNGGRLLKVLSHGELYVKEPIPSGGARFVVYDADGTNRRVRAWVAE